MQKGVANMPQRVLIGITLALAAAIASPAASKTSVVKGKSSLSIMQNTPPIVCPTEQDCGPGQVCHLSITVTGAPAMRLLQALKQRGVQRDQNWHEMGLELYFSKDDLLTCDATNKASPSCSISLNPADVKMETAPACE
jgi:hypothetical protein